MESSIKHHAGGTMFAGREAVDVFRGIVIANALEFYAKTGMKVNRAYTPTAMLGAAKGITGKTYKRGQYAAAAADIREAVRIARAAIPETVEGVSL